VHVEGEQSSLLHQFLLRRKLNVESLNGLSKKLFLSCRAEHFRKDRLTFGDVTSSESGKTELHDGSVVEDLGGDVCLGNSVLEMGHEQQVTSLVVSAMGCVVVDVGKDSSSTEKRGVRSVDVDTEGVNQSAGITVGTERGDVGVHAVGGRVDGILKVVNDRVRLE
jgi:hypothetical protein